MLTEREYSITVTLRSAAEMLAPHYTDEEIIQKINVYMDGSEHPDLVGYRKQTRVWTHNLIQ